MIGIALEEESERPHHKKAERELVRQLLPIFDSSSEGIFVYLDDDHKSCNEKLAAMFGYTPLQWEELQPIEKMFSTESGKEVMATYYEKIIAERAPAELDIVGLKKDGSTFKARLLMVPISYDELLFMLCFIKPIGEEQALTK